MTNLSITILPPCLCFYLLSLQGTVSNLLSLHNAKTPPLCGESYFLFPRDKKKQSDEGPFFVCASWNELVLHAKPIWPSSLGDSDASHITSQSIAPCLPRCSPDWPWAISLLCQSLSASGPLDLLFSHFWCSSSRSLHSLFFLIHGLAYMLYSKQAFPENPIESSAPSHAITFSLSVLACLSFFTSTNQYLKYILDLFVYCVSSPRGCGHHNNGETCLSCSLLCS